MRTTPLVVFAIVAGLPACNPDGTCLTDDKHAKTCSVKYDKAACSTTNPSTVSPPQFFEEDESRGLARCKEAGFDTSSYKEGQGGVFTKVKPQAIE